MSWVDTTVSVLYYSSLPITTILSWFLLPLRPFIHLFNYALQSVILTFQYLAKFESLYIYFTTAALIGLLSGTIIHQLSNLLHSLVDLQTETPNPSSTQSPSKPKYLENESPKTRILPPTKQDVSKAYQEYWESSLSASEKRRGSMGNLLAKDIILEEEDSDDMF